MLNSHINLLIEMQIAEIAKLQGVLKENPNYFPPTISEEAFLNLPAPIAEAVNQYQSLEEKSIALLSIITAAASGIDNLKIPYRSKFYNTNIYLVVAGPPASNKGIALHSREILKLITKKYKDKYSKEKAEFIDTKKQQKLNQRSNKSVTEETTSENNHKSITDNLEIFLKIPKLKYAILPADISASALVDLIHTNDGSGLIFDSEAQTILNTFKQEWGSNLVSILLKAFENEPVELSRRSMDSLISIEKPKLSVLLTGNPEHLYGLVKAISNGLYSRFAIYLTQKTGWKDINQEENDKDYLKGYKYLSEIIDVLNNQLTTVETEFSLTKDQLKYFNYFFGNLDRILSETIDSNFSSVVKRQAVMFYRFCAVLTAIRFTENLNSKIICTDEDFITVIFLCSTLLQHSIYTFLTKAEEKNQTDEFIDLLPDSFNRKEAMDVAKFQKISLRRMDNYLKESIGKKLRKIRHGEYEKITPAILQNVQYEEAMDSSEYSGENDSKENQSTQNLEISAIMDVRQDNESNVDFITDFLKSIEVENTETAHKSEMSKFDNDIQFVLSSFPFDFDEEFEAAVYSIFHDDLSYYSKVKDLILDEFVDGLQSIYSLSDKEIKHIVSKLKELKILEVGEDDTIVINS